MFKGKKKVIKRVKEVKADKALLDSALSQPKAHQQLQRKRTLDVSLENNVIKQTNLSKYTSLSEV